MDDQEIFFSVFVCNTIIVNHFLYCFMILIYLIPSSLSIICFICSMRICFYKSIDFILLLLLPLNVILLTSSVKTSCCSRLNLCCEFKWGDKEFYNIGIRYGNNKNVILAISLYIQNFDIFNTWSIVKTLSNISDGEAYWEPWQNSLFRHFWTYSETFSNIQP